MTLTLLVGKMAGAPPKILLLISWRLLVSTEGHILHCASNSIRNTG